MATIIKGDGGDGRGVLCLGPDFAGAVLAGSKPTLRGVVSFKTPAGDQLTYSVCSVYGEDDTRRLLEYSGKPDGLTDVSFLCWPVLDAAGAL